MKPEVYTGLTAERRMFSEGGQFLLFRRERDKLFIPEPLIWKESNPNSIDYGPLFELPATECQELMDRLHYMGYRPTHARDTEGIIKAKDAHIEDLRRIAFPPPTPVEPRTE